MVRSRLHETAFAFQDRDAVAQAADIFKRGKLRIIAFLTKPSLDHPVGCSTGKLPELAPLWILSTNTDA